MRTEISLPEPIDIGDFRFFRISEPQYRNLAAGLCRQVIEATSNSNNKVGLIVGILGSGIRPACDLLMYLRSKYGNLPMYSPLEIHSRNIDSPDQFTESGFRVVHPIPPNDQGFRPYSVSPNRGCIVNVRNQLRLRNKLARLKAGESVVVVDDLTTAGYVAHTAQITVRGELRFLNANNPVYHATVVSGVQFPSAQELCYQAVFSCLTENTYRYPDVPSSMAIDGHLVLPWCTTGLEELSQKFQFGKQLHMNTPRRKIVAEMV